MAARQRQRRPEPPSPVTLQLDQEEPIVRALRFRSVSLAVRAQIICPARKRLILFLGADCRELLIGCSARALVCRGLRVADIPEDVLWIEPRNARGQISASALIARSALLICGL